MTAAEEETLLRRGLEQLGLESDERRIAALITFIGELRLWNRRISLVADPGRELVVRHLLDSLAPLPLLRELGGLEDSADVGSGNGFPALPLALYEPRFSVTLIERSGKKAGFLRNAAALAGAGERVRVEEEDVLRTAARGRRFPLVISRAFLPFAEAYPLLEGVRQSPGGTAVYYGGRRESLAGEISHLSADQRARCRIVAVDVPMLAEERNLVVMAD